MIQHVLFREVSTKATLKFPLCMSPVPNETVAFTVTFLLTLFSLPSLIHSCSKMKAQVFQIWLF